MPFRPGTIDGAISISCLQWLCNADYKCNNPRKRLLHFFQTLYGCLRLGAKAIFQFYPENDAQIELITSSALLAGFSGGITIDYPESSKKKKYFLCLFAGGMNNQIPRGKSEVYNYHGADDGVEVSEQIVNTGRSVAGGGKSERRRKGLADVKDRNWVLKKKEVRRRRGQQTANDSKYTARKRKPKF